MVEHGRSLKLNQARLGETIGFDGSVVSRLISGTYPTEIDEMVGRIDLHRRLLAQEAVDQERPICDTWVLDQIAVTCTMTRNARCITVLTGRSHTGKTTGAQVYTRRNNHGQTIYVRMPPGGAPRMFLIALARACGISARNAYDQLRDRLLAFFKPGMLLIVDEIHQTIIGRKFQQTTLELIRDVRDLAGCGVVLCGTPVFDDAFRDEKTERFLQQISERAPIRRRLPDTAPWGDVEMILNAYGLPPASREKLDPQHHASPLAIIKERMAKNGLGQLTEFLLIAKEPAKKRKELFGWFHVVGTDAMLKSWERGDGPRDEKGGR